MGRVPVTVPTRVSPLLIFVLFSVGAENHESGQGQLSRHMYNNSGSCIPLLAIPGLSHMSAQSLLPLPHWFYLPGSSWLPGDCTIREEQIWIAEQWSCCEFWKPNASWVPLPTLFAQFRGSESGKITGCGVICRNQPAIAIPSCTTSLHPGKVSRE